MLNIQVDNHENTTDAFEQIKDRVQQTIDLGSIMLHVIDGGFLAYTCDGRAILAGTAADLHTGE